MDVTLNWTGGLSFEGVGNSGFMQKLDADESVGGGNSAARPMEYIAFALAGCTGMDVISILRKKRQVIKDFQVRVHAEYAQDHPKVFTRAIIKYLIHGTNIDEAAVLRAIELSTEKYCPVQAMLSKAFPMRFEYEVFGGDAVTPLAVGEYIQKQTGE